MTMTTDPRSKPVPDAWGDHITAWSATLAAAHASPATIRTRTDHLRRASRALGPDPWAVDADALLAWVGTRTWSRETRRNTYASLRSFWRWAIATEQATSDPTRALPRVRATEPKPRPAPAGVVRQGLDHADPRTWIILRLARELGMRRGEIARVHAADIWEDLAGWSITAHGKGGRDRDLPMRSDLARLLLRRCAGGWLLPSDRHPSGHLTPEYVGKLATRALPGVWTLHTLRHACATDVHDRTHDLLLVQRLLGHASVATTQRYVLVRDDALRAALAA